MRALIAAATLSLAFTLPHAAFAQEADPLASSSPEMEQLVDRLSDPEQQDRAADVVHSLTDVMLALPIGELIHAAQEATGEESSEIDKDATVRELMGEDAEGLPTQLADRVPQMMSMLAGLVEGLDAMRPALVELSETMREKVAETGEL